MWWQESDLGARENAQNTHRPASSGMWPLQSANRNFGPGQVHFWCSPRTLTALEC